MSAEGLMPLSNPLQAKRSKDNSNQKKTNLQLLLNKTLFTTTVTRVIWVMQTNMSAFQSTHTLRVEEHKRSTFGMYIQEEDGKDAETMERKFKIFKKCQSKLDYLIFEIFFFYS